MEKIKIYAVLTGCGKTYFCQHNPGWADIDEELFVKFGNLVDMLAAAYKTYARYGYKIMTGISPFILYTLQKYDCFDVTLILPPKTMKLELITRVLERGDIEWAQQLSEKWFDIFYDAAEKSAFKKIYLKEGDFISDIKEKLE